MIKSSKFPLEYKIKVEFMQKYYAIINGDDYLCHDFYTTLDSS